MNLEKILDGIADAILGIVPMLLGLFGHRDDVKAVQEKVVELCGFLPAAAAVSAMFAAGGPVTGVLGIASAICQAVSASPAVTLISASAPTVNGVPITGEWVSPKGK